MRSTAVFGHRGLAPLGAADYERAHRRAPPPALAQQLAHAHTPAACLLYTGPESLHAHKNTRSSRTHTLPQPSFFAQDRCCCTRTGTRAAAPLSGSSASQHAHDTFLVSPSAPLWPAFFLFPFAARLAKPARTHARAHERPVITEDTTCGPPAWLTGSRSVRSPPRRAPVLATPIAMPLQGGRPERSGLFILKLLEESG